MPGVLVIEAMAQAAAILSFKTLGQLPDDSSVYYFVGIDNARFKKPVSAGDQLILDVQLNLNKRGIWKYTAVAQVADVVVAEASLICSVKPSA
jgi:3-hydroxymyristoyl/3-hydroxydecanoyl-(acyl carrier protein) dehydratases